MATPVRLKIRYDYGGFGRSQDIKDWIDTLLKDEICRNGTWKNEKNVNSTRGWMTGR